jgi:hypothetical protein
MPNIMILCPILRKPVKTGLATETIRLDSLDDDLTITLQCPACLKLHKWRRKDSWVEEVWREIFRSHGTPSDAQHHLPRD